MNESKQDGRGSAGMLAGAGAVVALFVVGTAAGLASMSAADRNAWDGAGLCLIASALAFGFAASAVWRR